MSKFVERVLSQLREWSLVQAILNARQVADFCHKEAQKLKKLIVTSIPILRLREDALTSRDSV
jgi:hypothetical protein